VKYLMAPHKESKFGISARQLHSSQKPGLAAGARPGTLSQAATKPVDHASLRTNQAAIIAFLLLAFILNFPLLVVFTALVMLVGTALRRPGFLPIYTQILKPRGWVKPEILQDNPEPHRFAQGFGGVVLAGSVLAFLLGASTLGWALGWLVIALASLNLFAGFCAGCAVYYWLNRLHVPGFVKAPPAGIFPGLKPKAR
jgi:hypothetical protein